MASFNFLSDNSDPNNKKPFIVYEIKKECGSINDDTLQQAKKYNENLKCKFICITNINAEIWYNCEGNLITRIETPKSFNKLLESKYKFSQGYEFVRQSFKECREKDYFTVYNKFLGVIGDDTPKVLHPFIINLYGFFMENIKHINEPIKVNDFEIIEDGIRNTSFGNAGGGSFDGFYRYYILKFPNGENNIVSLSIFGIEKQIKEVNGENRNSCTSLVIAIDDFDKRHISLELNLDKFLTQDDETWQMFHNGKITVGKLGAAKKSHIIDFCKKYIPDLIKGDNIFLGKLPKKMLFNWDNSSELIINLIRYALARDNYRKIHKESLK